MSKMKKRWRVFSLLMYKNFLIRKRHWKSAIFVQILIPIGLFLFAQAIRDSAASPPKPITNDTIHEKQSMDEKLFIERQIQLYYAPYNPFTEKIMASVRTCLGLPDSGIRAFKSEEDALKTYTLEQNIENANKVVMILFQSDSDSKVYDYVLRTQKQMPHALFITPGVAEMVNFLMFESATPFIQLQHCLNMDFINSHANVQSNVTTKVFTQQMPSPPYILIDPGDILIRAFVSLIASIAFLIPLFTESNFAASEKFIGVNVLMSMNGVKTSWNLLSWLMSGLLFSIFYISPVVILFKITFSEKVYPFLYYSNGFIFWLFLFLHMSHLLMFGMHVTSYFSKPIFMSSGIMIAYICSSLILKYTAWTSFSKHTPIIGILFPNILLFRAFEEMNLYESKLTGIQWSNLFRVADQTYNVAGSVGMIMILSIIGTVVHFYLTLYIYAVKPGKYGVRKHMLYFLESFRRNKINTASSVAPLRYNNANEPFEPVPDSSIAGIQIRELKKTYCTSLLNKSCTVDALKGISIDFHKSQITALLGHNGAGKTTMMSILTGMISPTDGTILVNGKNISKDLDSIMNDLGLCPQDDILFPDLSVFEQLLFFGLLKRKCKNKQDINRDIDRLLAKLNLSAKRNALPAELSGGQKRRVCLGMALIGNASTLILDEPTSGMDPESRRDTWDIILGMREEKTILISTHNMEEADILGDRIAIIHSGLLRCYGTSMFLKRIYGQGNMEVTFSTNPSCDSENVRKLLGQGAEIINYDGARLILSVPYTDQLPDDLDNIESKKSSLGITGMSVSLITLEQVFLKVTKDPEDAVDHHLNLLEAPRKVTGTKLRNQRITALLDKKCSYTKKNIGVLAGIMILPLIGVVFMMNFSFPTLTEDNVSMDLSVYSRAEAYFSAKPDIYGQKYTEIVEKQSGTTHAVGSNETLVSALLAFAKRDNTTYMNNVIVAADFDKNSTVLSATALFSNTAIYSLPISLNLLYNAILKSFAGDEYEISISTKTLPTVQLSTSLDEEKVLAYGRVFILVGFMFAMIALFLIHPRREKMTGIKHLQRMTGISCPVYWLTMFIFDLAIYFVASLLIIITISIMDSINNLNLYLCHELMIILLLLILFAMNALPLMYIISFCKKQTNTLISIMTQVPICLTIAELILKSLISLIQNPSLAKSLRGFQKAVFYLLPHMSFFNGNAAFAFIAARNARCRNMPKNLIYVACTQGDECCDMQCSDGVCKKRLPYFKNFTDDPSLEECVVALACTSVLYFAILFALEMNVFEKLIYKMKKFKAKSSIENSDEQVKLEKHEVALEINKMRHKSPADFAKQQKEDTVDGNFLSTIADNNLFLVYELSKRYKRLFAVKEVSFKIRQRECFGLLGINGAGKSTTFRMLTGEELPDNGNLFLKEKSINTDRTEYLSQMGYCPQNSAIIETLNAKDHLRLFGLLRGVPRNIIDIEVEKWIDKLNLHACAAKPSGTYSGGNKRRLNIAIAMIGNPSLVLLDEPTTGVDPAARRSLWDVIASCQKSGQSIILTSHSMEECEALCNRLVIMVKGELVCIGPSQQLKQKFGAGFDIQIKLKPNRTEDALKELNSEIETRLPCEISDENIGLITYHVTNDRLTWKAMYSALNILKENHSIIEDYTIISATLEQLFLQFARAAKVSDMAGQNNRAVMV